MPREGDRFISTLFRGGPFAHRAVRGRCAVCGATGAQLADLGCPVQGIPHVDGTPLIGAAAFERACRETWAARREEGQG